MARLTELVKALQKKYEGLPLIMTGNFNTEEQSEYYKNFLRDTGVMDAKYKAETLVKDYSTSSSEIGILPNEGNGHCIDHIFVNNGVGVKLFDAVIDCGIENASDHIPIYADMTF